MDSIKTLEELRDVPTTYKQVFINTFTNSVDKTKTISAKYNDAITDRDIDIAEFLFQFRYATISQIYKYLELKNNLGEDTTEASLKIRLDKLVKIYRVLNKFVLSPYDCSGFENGELEFYCLDLGGQFLLYNFTNQSETNIINWRPKNANIHTPETVYRDIRIVDFYLKLLDVFGQDLVYFQPYKHMSYDKKQTIVTFDFCIDKDQYGDYKYFIGQLYTLIKDSEMESAIDLAKSVSLRKIERYRITTIDRVKDDLSTAFMVYDNGELKVGKSQFFEK